MSSHYGVHLIPDAHKNAMNVVYALWKVEGPASSENFSQPANASSSPDDPIEYWFGGKPYLEAELPIIQAMATNMPAATWPVQGVEGPVTLAQAEAAVAALIVSVTTRDAYTTQQAQDTINALLTVLGVQRLVFQ